MPINRLLFKAAEEARDSITRDQQRKIAQYYRDWANELAAEAERLEGRTNISSLVEQERLRELEQRMRIRSQEISNQIYNDVRSNLYLTSDAVMSANSQWLSNIGFNRDNVDASFSNLPESIINNLVTGQVYGGGWSLSARIWGENEKTLADIYAIIAEGRAKNEGVFEIAQRLSQYVQPGAGNKWNLQMTDGRWIYKKTVDYVAQRLARTLIQHTYQQSFVQATLRNPFVTEYRWNANGSRVCPVCLAMNGRRFPKDSLPLDHPNGMCTMEPVIMDNYEQRMADWLRSPPGTYPDIDRFSSILDNESYYVPQSPTEVRT